MRKNQYFDADNICVEDAQYLLKRQTEDDKEDYFVLYAENSKFSNMNEFNEFMEWNWNKNQEEDSVYISVFQKNPYAYVGNIVLRNLESTTPEIGIDVLTAYKRKGIASHVLPLFMNKVAALQKIDFFMARIYSDNIPSIGLFTKLGAIEYGREPSEYQAFLNEIKEKYDSEAYKKIVGDAASAEEIAGQKYIGHYKIVVNM